MTVYFLRHDSDMAKCLRHLKEASHLIEGVGRVGVCNANFDYEEIFSIPYWAMVINAGLIDKLAAFNENITVEGFYSSTIVGNTMVRAFTVSGIWDLDTQTRWSWGAAKRKATEWGLKFVTITAETTVKEIMNGRAERDFLKKGHSLVFMSLDGKKVFSQQ
ncbi:hypothetical protein SLS62_001775 [Diatrype stigma]|uniref:Uncharacterized protein n=1 Tax=Diatrype stigma TaxID=117547 RepID=A0AAN9YVI2_9PEZI